VKLENKPIINASVIVPNHNNGKYLDEFLVSILKSTVEPLEVIIVDDGSSDNSNEVLEKYKQIQFLKLISFADNKGLPAALNAALEASKGKYVLRADPDDLLAPDRLEKQYNFMENHPEVDILGCNVVYINVVSGRKINTSNFPVSHKGIVSAFKKGEHGIQHPTAFIKGDVYRKYRYQKVFPAEDYEIFSRMVRDGYTFANLKSPLYYMRVHPGSATSNLKKQHIEDTFNFRKQIFGHQTSPLRKTIYFYHVLFYRKFQLAKGGIIKILFLFLSSVLYPSKVFKRIFNSQ
jgi:glycosyltransferase involved in cell wall biosynthesis